MTGAHHDFMSLPHRHKLRALIVPRMSSMHRGGLNLGSVHCACVASSTATVAQGDYGQLRMERGTRFVTGPSFYRPESVLGRDLAMLSASVYKHEVGSLRVLDVMAGSGVRGARYLRQAGADLVWCNDYNPKNRLALVYNLAGSLTGLNGVEHLSDGQGEAGWHLLAEKWLSHGSPP